MEHEWLQIAHTWRLKSRLFHSLDTCMISWYTGNRRSLTPPHNKGDAYAHPAHHSHRRNLLRFARLCHYLRVRQPDAMIGYSILVYRLDQAELNGALNGNLHQLALAIDHAMTVRLAPVSQK